MSNPLVGNVEAFDANDDDFPCYAERIEQYILANNITDEKRKTAVFLSLVGGKTNKPSELRFSEIIDLLKAHFNPKPLVIAERCKFHYHRQEDTENVADYLAALRKCEDYCNFGDFLQQAPRDRCVWT